MSAISEYNRVTLKIAAKNFVARARVEGQDDPHGTKWAVLGTTTLYDLSDEKLGHNSTLQIPVTTFKYLRVTLDSSVKPADLRERHRRDHTGTPGCMADPQQHTPASQAGKRYRRDIFCSGKCSGRARSSSTLIRHNRISAATFNFRLTCNNQLGQARSAESICNTAGRQLTLSKLQLMSVGSAGER